MKNIEFDKKTIYEQLLIYKSENEKLKKQYKNKIINNITNNTMNNTTNNIHINLSLVGYGNEDINKLDKEEIIKSLKQGFLSTIKLTENIQNIIIYIFQT
jgi:uncharacterized protein YbgA (DUF1722 family)